MIVRIATEGQYRLSDEHAARLDELDDKVVAAVDAGERGRFHELFEQMLELVRSAGEKLAEEELAGSDVILPPPDTSLEEAAAEFTGEGLIPG